MERWWAWRVVLDAVDILGSWRLGCEAAVAAGEAVVEFCLGRGAEIWRICLPTYIISDNESCSLLHSLHIDIRYGTMGLISMAYTPASAA